MKSSTYTQCIRTLRDPPQSSPLGRHIVNVTERKYTHKQFLTRADAPILAVNTARSA